MLDMRHIIGVLRYIVGFGETLLHIALAQLEMVRNIGACDWMEDRRDLVATKIRMDNRRVGLHTLDCICNGGQLLIFNLDQIDRLLRDLKRLSRDSRNSLAAEFGRADRQEVFILQIESAALFIVFAGDNALDARQLFSLGGVDAQNLGVRVRAALDLRVQHARHFHIVNIFCLASYLFDSVNTINRYAHAFHLRTPPSVCSATSSMASIIFLYPVQRHRFPLIPRAISSRVGCGFSRSSAVAVIKNPGVQKPH